MRWAGAAPPGPTSAQQQGAESLAPQQHVSAKPTEYQLPGLLKGKKHGKFPWSRGYTYNKESRKFYVANLPQVRSNFLCQGGLLQSARADRCEMPTRPLVQGAQNGFRTEREASAAAVANHDGETRTLAQALATEGTQACHPPNRPCRRKCKLVCQHLPAGRALLSMVACCERLWESLLLQIMQAG